MLHFATSNRWEDIINCSFQLLDILLFLILISWFHFLINIDKLEFTFSCYCHVNWLLSCKLILSRIKFYLIPPLDVYLLMWKWYFIYKYTIKYWLLWMNICLIINLSFCVSMIYLIFCKIKSNYWSSNMISSNVG